MPGKRTRVEAKCQWNEVECRGMQGNTGEYRGMTGERMGVGAKCQGNARGKYGSGCKRPGECRECRIMQGNVWEWVYSARGMQGDYQGNAREWV